MNVNNTMTIISRGANANETLSQLPPDFTQISELNKRCVLVYSVLFIFAAIGNIFVLFSGFGRKKLRTSRISLLIRNLCVADLIVTFFLMPTEIFWRVTIAWKGGDVLCKLTQFVRAFGLYLSSNVVICISVDRYFSIVHPLKLASAVWRVKITLVGAWIISAGFAGPQMFIYHVASHPDYPEFQQCITKAFLTEGPYNELMYNVGSVSALYFIPLLVVIYTYTMILWKLYRKSMEQRLANNQQEVASSPIDLKIRLDQTVSNSGSNIYNFYRKLSNATSTPGSSTKSTRIILRCSGNGRNTLNRARSRTLRLTLLILMTFIACWTPYVVMTLWYMLDRTGASQVDEQLQEFLFLMTVTNSVINPFIYGTVVRQQKLRKKYNVPVITSCVAKRLACYPLPKGKWTSDLFLKSNNGDNNGDFLTHEYLSEGVHKVSLMRKKLTNFDTGLGFTPRIKRGGRLLTRKNDGFIIPDRFTI